MLIRTIRCQVSRCGFTYIISYSPQLPWEPGPSTLQPREAGSLPKVLQPELAEQASKPGAPDPQTLGMMLPLLIMMVGGLVLGYPEYRRAPEEAVATGALG